MVTKLARKIFKSLFKKPVTNLFPAKYAPDSVLDLFEAVEDGKAELNEPINTPKDFRGRLRYDKDTCIGCQQCMTVCPSQAISFQPEEEKIKISISRCTFCSQCVEICPVNCLEMSDEFLLADFDKYSDDLIEE